MLAAGSRIALTACSHGLLPRGRAKVEGLVEYLDDLGIEVTLSPALYLPPQRHGHFEEGISASRGRTLRTHNPAHSAPDPVRARILNEFFADPSVDAIFDVSGGAIANGVLPYLDWDVIRENPKPFVGYSDLSTVVNAIHTQTGRTTYLWQILALGSDESAWEPNVVERYG
nr:hypothetical protein [Actinomycetales bacterium]